MATRSYLNKPINAASDQHVSIGRECSALWVRLLAKLDGPIELVGAGLHVFHKAHRLASKQVKGGASWGGALLLLPVVERSQVQWGKRSQVQWGKCSQVKLLPVHDGCYDVFSNTHEQPTTSQGKIPHP